ncbi:MAG: bifunctional hydroxymethylpyrimidine kinase/phosphomethylpyrimidine kinase [Magnetococcales bacterium]|nr:bifunctional hydroxymethylpyrimidine kinase/phosphomethylpyrimidine kinase [Magnetococcales bacterium]
MSSDKKRVLIVAGSDPVAGAGLQADLKTVTALGCYGMTVVTAITVQDSRRVWRVHPLDGELVAAQMRACLEDVGADCIKLGMLATERSVAAVADLLEEHPHIPVVADPVLAGTGGGVLLERSGHDLFLTRLLPRIALLTPNLPEAARLSCLPVDSIEEMGRAARHLLALGAGGVLVKGGHGTGAVLTDLLAFGPEIHLFSGPRLAGPGFHGTGCVLASAIASGLAAGFSLPEAVTAGRAHLRGAMERALALGRGQWLLG